jgi:hypothetical protein
MKSVSTWIEEEDGDGYDRRHPAAEGRDDQPLVTVGAAPR